MTPLSTQDIVTVLLVMLGPFKIIAPFATMTYGADQRFVTRLALRAIGFSVAALLLAGLMGQRLLAKYSIPLPVLGLAAGIVLFLVALLPMVQQFSALGLADGESLPPTLASALTPLAFPTIVTPYGIASLIIFDALAPTVEAELTLALIVLAIMLMDLVAMLLARHILRFMGVPLQLVGAILGIIQVAVGLRVILGSVPGILSVFGL
jgi:small neutral amino acid transporter SnatA (MarC family)